MGQSPPDIPDVVGRLARALTVASAGGALIVFVYMGVLPSVFASRDARTAGRTVDGWIIAAVVAYLLVSGVANSVLGARRGRPIAAWGARGGEPTAAERDAVLRRPARSMPR